MIGIGGAVVVFRVAGIAIGGSAGELSVDVALIAGDIYVRAGQRKFGERIVIEIGAVPGCGGVAESAIRREILLERDSDWLSSGSP